MADHEGGGKANYHGTTVLAQTMRDLWPGFSEKMSEAGIMKVCPVSINNFEDSKRNLNSITNRRLKPPGLS